MSNKNSDDMIYISMIYGFSRPEILNIEKNDLKTLFIVTKTSDFYVVQHKKAHTFNLEGLEY